MTLRDDLQAAVKDAMRARAADRLSTLRLISAAIKDREIAARGEAGGEAGGAGGAKVTDADILAILGRMVKQRHESARAYQDGGRPELAAKELAEIAVVGEFLPRQLTDPEVDAAIAAAIGEAGATSLRDMGRVMGVLKARFAGQMDFGAVGPRVKDRLA